MFNWSMLIMFTLGAVVIIMSPGPDFLYVTTRGIAQGRRAGILSAAGISIGLLIHTAIAALGLSAILETSQFAFHVIKYVGAAYLVFLGIKALTAKGGLLSKGYDRSFNSRSIFQQGILTNVCNPKAMLTFMAFIPQFIHTGGTNYPFQVLNLGGIIAGLAVVWFGVVGYFAGSIGTWLLHHHLLQNAIRWITGSVLVGLGIRLAWTKHQ